VLNYLCEDQIILGDMGYTAVISEDDLKVVNMGDVHFVRFELDIFLLSY
jgi:hypothetical protein